MNDLSIFDAGACDKREAIVAYEQELLKMPQIDMSPEHFFALGLYGRGLLMPKGSSVTGKVHKKSHLVVIFGDVTVTGSDGTQRYTGLCIFQGKPNEKRALLMHEDTYWLAIHSTDKETVEECEASLVHNDYQEYLGAEKCRIG